MAGWPGSPIGANVQNDEVPGEEATDYDDQTPDCTDWLADQLPPIWTDSASKVPLCDQADVEQEADGWAGIWQEAADYLCSVLPSEASRPQALGAAQMRAASRTFPYDTGLGADNVAPRAIERLSDDMLQRLAQLLSDFECAGCWARTLRLVLTVLLPKTDGGRRPIGLFPTIVRVWMRACANYASAWRAEHEREGVSWAPRRGASIEEE